MQRFPDLRSVRPGFGDAPNRGRVIHWLAGAVAVVLATGGLAQAQAPDSSAARTPGNRVVANTAGCGHQRIGEIDVAVVGNRPIIAVAANGVFLDLLLDTGAQQTILTPAAAVRAKAQPPRIEFRRNMRGVAGSLATNEVELRSFSAGAVALPWRRVAVAPISIQSQLDGLLGADALDNFDIDIDLPRRWMAFYRKQTCANAAPAWPPPFSAMDTGRSAGEHLFFPVQLDGRKITAFVDTGASITTLSTRAARAFGVTDAILAREPSLTLQGATAAQLTAHLHRFSRLQVGTEVVLDPRVAVADFNVNDADIVLGVDFIGSRRIWLSYGSRRIFIAKR